MARFTDVTNGASAGVGGEAFCTSCTSTLTPKSCATPLQIFVMAAITSPRFSLGRTLQSR